MPYLTPESVPVDVTAWTLFIPDSVQWLSIVKGALLELCALASWEQSDNGVSPSSAVEASIAIFESMGAAQAGMKIGSIQMGLYSVTPAGWLACDGSNYAMADYAELMEVYPAALKNTPLAGRFTVPDMSGRVAVGTGPGYALLAAGGSATHTLTVAEMPSHSHNTGVPSGGGTSGNYFNASTARSSAVNPPRTWPEGGGAAHNNMQPYRAIGYYLVASNET